MRYIVCLLLFFSTVHAEEWVFSSVKSTEDARIGEPMQVSITAQYPSMYAPDVKRFKEDLKETEECGVEFVSMDTFPGRFTLTVLLFPKKSGNSTWLPGAVHFFEKKTNKERVYFLDEVSFFSKELVLSSIHAKPPVFSYNTLLPIELDAFLFYNENTLIKEKEKNELRYTLHKLSWEVLVIALFGLVGVFLSYILFLLLKKIVHIKRKERPIDFCRAVDNLIELKNLTLEEKWEQLGKVLRQFLGRMIQKNLLSVSLYELAPIVNSLSIAEELKKEIISESLKIYDKEFNGQGVHEEEFRKTADTIKTFLKL